MTGQTCLYERFDYARPLLLLDLASPGACAFVGLAPLPRRRRLRGAWLRAAQSDGRAGRRSRLRGSAGLSAKWRQNSFQLRADRRRIRLLEPCSATARRGPGGTRRSSRVVVDDLDGDVAEFVLARIGGIAERRASRVAGRGSVLMCGVSVSRDSMRGMPFVDKIGYHPDLFPALPAGGCEPLLSVRFQSDFGVSPLPSSKIAFAFSSRPRFSRRAPVLLVTGGAAVRGDRGVDGLRRG